MGSCVTSNTSKRPLHSLENSRHLCFSRRNRTFLSKDAAKRSTLLPAKMKYKVSLHVLLAAGLAQSAPLPPYASVVTRVCHSGGITVDGAVASVICTQPASAIQTMEEDFTLDNHLIRRQGSSSELAGSYAALILADDGVEITADKLNTLIAAASVEEVEPIWTSLFAKALEGKDVASISNPRNCFVATANPVLMKYAEGSAHEYWRR